MIRKEIWHGMRAYKATFFIKGYRQRAVAGSHLQYRKLSAVFFNKKFNQRFGIAFSLKWGNCSDILNFKYSIPFVRYDTLAFHSVIIKNIHFTFIEITVNHIFLLIRQQEQIKILFFVFCNFYNSHQSHLQIPIYLLNPLKTLYFQGISPILCSNLMCFPLFLPLRAETRESFLLSADHLIQQSCGSTLRFPCSVSVNIHCGTDIGVSEKLLHILRRCPV